MLQVLTDEEGKKFLKEFLPEKTVEFLSTVFGISGVANVIGAIKMAKYYGFTSEHNIFTIATDNIDRYHSVMEQMTKTYGKLDRGEAKHRFESIFLGAKTDWIFEGTVENRERWHNLKYYTWVEQQGKTVEELNAQRTPEFWQKERDEVKVTDEMLLDYRKKYGV
jgi:hypothetical protein